METIDAELSPHNEQNGRIESEPIQVDPFHEQPDSDKEIQSKQHGLLNNGSLNVENTDGSNRSVISCSIIGQINNKESVNRLLEIQKTELRNDTSSSNRKSLKQLVNESDQSCSLKESITMDDGSPHNSSIFKSLDGISDSICQNDLRNNNYNQDHKDHLKDDNPYMEEENSFEFSNPNQLKENSSNQLKENETTHEGSIVTEEASENVDDVIQNFIFLFYNPTSGGNTASVLADPSLSHAVLYFGNECVNLYLYDIRDGTPKRKPGFLKLKKIVETGEKKTSVKVVVGGGDGTVMWCISELRAHDIDLEHVSIGVIPFGTGNDFARALFWDSGFQSGRDPKSELRQLVYQWLTADIIQHDLWDVIIELNDIGTFKKIDPETRYKQVVTEQNERGQMVPIRVARYKMCNYFSIGVESRIGVGFDRYRTTSRFWNKLRYAAEGLKKSLLKHTLKINEIVSTMVIGDCQIESETEIFHCVSSAFDFKEPGSDYTHVTPDGSLSSFETPRKYKKSLRNSPLRTGRELSLDSPIRKTPSPLATTQHVTPISSTISPMMGELCDQTSNNRLVDQYGDNYESASFESWMSDVSRAPDVHVISPSDESSRITMNSYNSPASAPTGVTSHGLNHYELHTIAPTILESDDEHREASLSLSMYSNVEVESTSPSFTLLSPSRKQRSNCLHAYKQLDYSQIRSAPSSPVRAIRSVTSRSESQLGRASPMLLPAASLIAINIPSFAAGLDIWSNAHRVGLEIALDTPRAQRLLESSQKMGDGLLEFLTFSSAASIGFERMAGFQGRGKKICQAAGPFILEFNEMPREWRVYYQVDGEFYVMNNPLRLINTTKRPNPLTHFSELGLNSLVAEFIVEDQFLKNIIAQLLLVPAANLTAYHYLTMLTLLNESSRSSCSAEECSLEIRLPEAMKRVLAIESSNFSIKNDIVLIRILKNLFKFCNGRRLKTSST